MQLSPEKKILAGVVERNRIYLVCPGQPDLELIDLPACPDGHPANIQ